MSRYQLGQVHGYFYQSLPLNLLPWLYRAEGLVLQAGLLPEVVLPVVVPLGLGVAVGAHLHLAGAAHLAAVPLQVVVLDWLEPVEPEPPVPQVKVHDTRT